MARRILLITTDQMRHDALGVTGGRIARTPHIDSLAQVGVRYARSHCHNVTCMPARATILTGQYQRRHGVWTNGVALPEDAPSVAGHLSARGFRTALIGKAHFEPWLGLGRFRENRMGPAEDCGPYRGFEHVELANHFFMGTSHYDAWLSREHSQWIRGFYPMAGADGRQNSAGGGDTGAVQVWHNDVPSDVYHTDWVAERTLAWLAQRADEESWFLWMSFPDPHHPWDPPRAELARIPWQEVPLPERYPRSDAERRAILSRKPRHWLGAYDATLHTNPEMPPGFVPAGMTEDQLREIEAMTHIENELIDDACGRVFEALRARGLFRDTDIFFTTDHGELQGDYGLLFKGPFHVDSLLRLPMIWLPSKAPGPSVVRRPVGHIHLAPTFCAVAGVEIPPWMEGVPLPRTDDEASARGFDRVVTEWESEHAGAGTRIMDLSGKETLRLRTIFEDDMLCTKYEKGSFYEGTEGELYDLSVDPQARENLWEDPSRQGIRRELLERLDSSLPPVTRREPRAAPL